MITAMNRKQALMYKPIVTVCDVLEAGACLDGVIAFVIKHKTLAVEAKKFSDQKLIVDISNNVSGSHEYRYNGNCGFSDKDGDGDGCGNGYGTGYDNGYGNGTGYGTGYDNSYGYDNGDYGEGYCSNYGQHVR